MANTRRQKDYNAVRARIFGVICTSRRGIRTLGTIAVSGGVGSNSMSGCDGTDGKIDSFREGSERYEDIER